MPTLADVLIKHAQHQQRADDNVKSMGKVWAEAFDTFVVEISHAIDVKLEATLRTIHQEVDNVQGVLGADRSSRNLRSENFRLISSAADRTKNDTGKEKEASIVTRSDGAAREQKRRRLDVTDLSSLELRQKGRVGQTENRLQGGVPSEIQDILSQMKLTIDEQAQSLQRLARENNEVRTSMPGNSISD